MPPVSDSFNVIMAVLSIVAIVWSSCGQKSNITGSGGGGAYGPERLAGSPYPISKEPDTLFVVDESKLTYTQILTVESLQGILAQAKPSVYIINGTNDAYSNWLSDLQTNYGVHLDLSLESNFTGVLSHFKNNIDGYITYSTTSSSEPSSIDVAISLAGIKNAIVVSSDDQQAVAALGIPLLLNVSNENYQQFINDYQGSMNKSAFCYQTSIGGKGQYLLDYAVFGKMFFYYGDISSSLTSQVFSDMNSNSVLLGWGSDEFTLVQTASQKSIMVHAADFAKNLSVLSNFGVVEKQASHNVNPGTVQNVHTVCFLMTDGDNVQWVLGNFSTDPNWYASPYRGKINLGWTISPALCELAPTVLKNYYDSEGKTEGGRDYFVAGPSGLGYMYPEVYSSLGSFAALTSSFMQKADLNIVNIIGSSNPPTIPVGSLVPYLNQDQVLAVFYYPYSNYAGCNGQIAWSSGKPIVTARYNLWSGQFEDPQSLAAKLNAASTDVTSSNGYSLVAVHVWTNSVADVVQCASLLNKNVRVVAPDEFVALVEKNVKH